MSSEYFIVALGVCSLVFSEFDVAFLGFLLHYCCVQTSWGGAGGMCHAPCGSTAIFMCVLTLPVPQGAGVPTAETLCLTFVYFPFC